MTWPVVTLLLMGVAWAESGAYVPYSGIERGTEGVQPMQVRIANDSGAPMVCRVALAHWYSEDLGVAAPGKTLEALLWHDPETGTLSLLNPSEDRMPVESLWCGAQGNAWATRAPLALPFTAGPAPAFARRCTAGEGGRLTCEAG